MLRQFSTRLLSPLNAAAPFTVFQATGMLMARPMPLQYSESEEGGPVIAREGYVSMVVIPRVSGDVSTFEKDKKVSVKLRSKQIGQIIAWKALRTPLVVNAYSKSVPVTLELRPTADSSEIELSLTPKEGEVEPVSLTLSSGEVKSFQILLEAALPHLYGWVGPNTMPRQAAASAGSKSPEDFFKQFAKGGE